jgi:hypothetical protein
MLHVDCLLFCGTEATSCEEVLLLLELLLSLMDVHLLS